MFQIDTSGAELFLAMLAGEAALETVMQHPAYQAVCAHGQRYGSPMTISDVRSALAGQASPFYGLRGLVENLGRIQALLAEVRARQREWERLAENELARLLPNTSLGEIRVYPIIGYDMGIGLDGIVCLNLNTPQYLSETWEMFYFILHEAVHVLYERAHPVPPLADVRTPREWRAYFALWLQNEGFAVYAPYHLRAARGHLADRDYQVLEDPASLAACRSEFAAACRRLDGEQALSQAEYLEEVFGDRRITYRAGCEIFRQVERTLGPAAVETAFGLPPEDFLARYGGCLG